MNDHNHLDILRQTELTRDQKQRLLEKIGVIFKNAINARSPKNRPPGKAGLRAEKGYYRLLYLEDNFRQNVNAREKAQPDDQPENAEPVVGMLRQLADIPELRSEILTALEAALEEIITPPRRRI